MLRTTIAVLFSTLLATVPLPAEDRLPAVAGQFYPADPAQLSGDITRYLNTVPKPVRLQKPMALITPHAGYSYSAPVAAHAFKQVGSHTYDVVVLIGKSHHEGFRFAAVWPHGAFHTPLGRVPVSPVAGELIAASPLFRAYADPHLPEHSLEVELPFLQTVTPGVPVVPVLLGFDDADMVEEMARILAGILQNKKALIIASTDLSHYPGYDDACRIDTTTLNSWKSMDPEKIRTVERRLMAEKTSGINCTMCGNAAVYVTMLAAKRLGAVNIDILKYANSGDVAGPSDRTVGYGAAVIY